MTRLGHAEIVGIVRMADSVIIDHDADYEPLMLARAVRQLWDACKHYEGTITWDTRCQRCAALLDKLYEADKRAEQAEAALAVALASNKEGHHGNES